MHANWEENGKMGPEPRGELACAQVIFKDDPNDGVDPELTEDMFICITKEICMTEINESGYIAYFVCEEAKKLIVGSIGILLTTAYAYIM